MPRCGAGGECGRVLATWFQHPTQWKPLAGGSAVVLEASEPRGWPAIQMPSTGVRGAQEPLITCLNLRGPAPAPVLRKPTAGSQKQQKACSSPAPTHR